MEDNILIDRKNGEVFFNDISMFVWRRDAGHRIQKGYEDIVGPATRTIISNATNEVMKEIFSGLAGRYSDHKNGSLAMKMLDELPKYGYGVPEVDLIDDRNCAARIRVHNCFNTEGYGKASKPVCYRMSGILSSLFAEAFRRKTSCIETKCRAMGNDHCEFKVSAMSIPYKPKARKIVKPKGLEGSSFKFDSGKGEIVRNRVNCTFFPRKDLKFLERESQNVIGPATKVIFYSIGRMGSLEAIGRNFMRSVMLKVIRKLSPKKILDRIVSLGPEYGFGVVRLENLDTRKKTFRLSLHNSAEAIGVRSNEPVCNLMAGYTSGVGDAVFGRSMMCTELRCKAQGHPHCEFLAEPASPGR